MTGRIPPLLFAGLLWASLAWGGEDAGSKPKAAPAPKAEPAPAPAPKAEPKPKAEPAPAPVPKAEPKPKAEPAPAPEPAPAASSGADVPAAIPADPQAFVRALYKGLEGEKGRLRGEKRMVAAIDAGLLLERTVAGLSTRPPKVWMAAARERLTAWIAAARDRLTASRADPVANIFPQAVMIISPRVLGVRSEGPDRAVVSVRYYALDRRTGMDATLWHRVYLARTEAGWHVADIEMLDSGMRLSSLALILLTDPEEESLPLEDSGVVGILALKSVVPGLLLAILLGLGAYFAMVRSTAKGKPGRGLKLFLMWMVIAGPILAGLVIFAAGLMDHLDRNGAVDEIARRGASLRLTAEAQQNLLGAQMLRARRRTDDAQKAFRQAMDNCDHALAPGAWPDNRVAMLVYGRLLMAVGDRSRREAEGYLKALTSPDMQPPMPAAHLLRARFCEQHKQWSEAAGATLSFIKLVGDDAFSYVRAAKFFTEAGDFKNADEMLRRAEKAEKFDQSMLIERIAIRAAQKRADDVIADIKAMMAPVSKNLGSTLMVCQQILGMAQDGRFGKVLADAKFRACINGIGKTRNAAVSRLLDRAGEHAAAGRTVQAVTDLAVVTKAVEGDPRSLITVCQQISSMGQGEGGKFQKIAGSPVFQGFMRNLQARYAAAQRRMRGGGHR